MPRHPLGRIALSHRSNIVSLPPPPLPRTGERWALFLDVDGTLLGFADDPNHVRVPGALMTTLATLRECLDGALALVSGRRIDDLDQLFAYPGWAMAGLHGLQRRSDDGSEFDFQTESTSLCDLQQGARALAAQLPGVRLENKGACVALHCREAPQQEAALAAGARQLAHSLRGYEVQPGDHVYELKPADIDKGRALEAFLDESPFRGRTPVYLGDDLTDEHAFNVVNARNGISVRVGQREPSEALFTLSNPAAVQDWLDAVCNRLSQQPDT